MEFEKEYYTEDDHGGFFLRLAAYLIDGVLVSVVIWILAFILIGSSFMTMAVDVENDQVSEEQMMALAGSMGLLAVISIVITWLYFAIMESSKNQATVGKMVLGLKVTNLNGDPIGFGQATGRYFGKIISALIMYIGFIMIAFTEKKQGLHDMIAATLVLKKDVPPLS